MNKNNLSLRCHRYQKEAVNGQRVIRTKFNWATLPFVFKYLCHFLFTIPVQAAYLNGEL